MLRKYVWGIVLIIALLIGGYSLFGTNKTAEKMPEKQQTTSETGVTVGKVAPSFTLDSLEGKKTPIGEVGKVYVLNFWASWCPPCREEFPELVAFAHKYQGKVEFQAINLQESEKKVDDFLRQGGYALPVLLDKDGTVAQRYKITAIPTTLVIDGKGIIRYRKSGEVTLAELESVIKGW
ncbi:TlpA family protein disulfide reductase [Azotosporobacter soli]|uniref:TlpA family protein disulfide reductase n=1 Tax=Azotosporobacter soli TaxID=3055040 RepID=UPI0031FF3730